MFSYFIFPSSIFFVFISLFIIFLRFKISSHPAIIDTVLFRFCKKAPKLSISKNMLNSTNFSQYFIDYLSLLYWLSFFSEVFSIPYFFFTYFSKIKSWIVIYYKKNCWNVFSKKAEIYATCRYFVKKVCIFDCFFVICKDF